MNAAGLNQETEFGINELFISYTNLEGIIESGNSVFARVSGYSHDRLQGAPHSIVRHADMPKAVFKLFWSTIKSKKSICAYVKNRSKDGKYYWVLATAFPSDNGYFSIRIKPSTEILNQVKKIYSEMVAIEKNSSVDESTAHLLKSLNQLGYDSYQDFSYDALFKELRSRTKHLLENNHTAESIDHTNVGKSSEYKFLKNLKLVCETRLTNLRRVILNAEESFQVTNSIQAQTSEVIAACKRLNNLGLNMSVTANKLGSDGVSLSVVSNIFQKNVSNVFQKFDEFSKHSITMVAQYRESLYHSCMALLQWEMLVYLANESLGAHTGDYKKDVRNIMHVIGVLRPQLLSTMYVLGDSFHGLGTYSKQIKSLLNTFESLDVVRIGGLVESSRTAQTEESFAPYVREITNFIEQVQGPIACIDKSSSKLDVFYKEFQHHISDMAYELVEMDMMNTTRKAVI